MIFSQITLSTNSCIFSVCIQCRVLLYLLNAFLDTKLLSVAGRAFGNHRPLSSQDFVVFLYSAAKIFPKTLTFEQPRHTYFV